MFNPQYLVQLHKKLDTYFDEEELNELCFNLGIQYDNISGRAKVHKARELVNFLVRHSLISELVNYCQKVRPAIVWTYQSQLFIAEDGQLISEEDESPPPLPEFDIRAIGQLVPPGGAIHWRDNLYVSRSVDEAFKREIVNPGSTVIIRAPRQTGKTSLLVRGLNHAQSHGVSTVIVDLQSLGSKQLTSLDVFLLELIHHIGEELDIASGTIDQLWQTSRSPQRNINYFLERVILPKFKTRSLVLAFDEADSLLKTDFYQDFFRLVRSWHNRRATHELWETFNIVLVISTEPYLLINNIHESPFNVGLRLFLPDFNVEQVQWLNQQHGQPVASHDFTAFVNLFNGHPFLTRSALYVMTMDKITWTQLALSAPTDDGPFGDHLLDLFGKIRKDAALQQGLRQVIFNQRCDDEMTRFRLLRVGLIRGSGDIYACRCGLYQQYFSDKLK